VSDYLQRLVLRGARAIADVPVIPATPAVDRAITPIPEIVEESPGHPSQPAPTPAAATPAIDAEPSTGLGRDPLPGPSATRAAAVPPLTQTQARDPVAPRLPAEDAAGAGGQSPTPDPHARAAARISDSQLPIPSPPTRQLDQPQAERRRPSHSTAEAPDLPAAALGRPAARSESATPSVAGADPSAGTIASEAPTGAPARPSPIAVPPAPSITIGRIDIDLLPPPASPRPTVERTRGFARYARLRRGLRS